MQLAGTRLPLGRFYSTILPDFDFETFSPAGFEWTPELEKFKCPKGATKKGLPAVGAAAYMRHPLTDVLHCSYNLKDGSGPKRWRPSQPLPLDLFAYLAKFDPRAPSSYSQAGIIEAHNSMFELRACFDILTKRYGWPPLHLRQFRCSMAKARAHALPGGLEPLGTVLGIAHGKDPEGKRLINKFSIPRDPTKKDARLRILPEEDPVDAEALYRYNDRDIVAESEASALIPDLPPMELEYWLADQQINFRGVGCDVPAVHDCIEILEQALVKYNDELYHLTGGAVARASELSKLKAWLSTRGVRTDVMDEDALDELLANPSLPDECRRALEIRQLVGSASVKKIYAMARQVTPDGNLCDMAIYHGARTGRDNGDGVQPLNMPKAGPSLKWCVTTGDPYSQKIKQCPWCALDTCSAFGELTPWEPRAVDCVLGIIATRSLDIVEYYFGNALLCISGCARGLFIAREDHQLQGVDYSSIEAVVAAAVSGEQWRLDAFAAGRDIYLESASRITKKPYDWYMSNGGKKHPDRQRVGKPAELGLGFGGWLGAWRQFDKSNTYSDDEVKQLVNAWRSASPRIVEMWGGQCRGKPWAPDRMELYGLEGMAILAIQNPGVEYSYGPITYFEERDCLYCKLPSGRHLAYHKPRLWASDKWEGQLQITFNGWNSNPNKGAIGWIRMSTYGGSLFENVVQAIARDIMAHGVLALEAAGFPVVLRVHDEVVTEVPLDSTTHTIARQVALMTSLPPWAEGWPVRAAGWEAPQKRFMKD
jgi:DNA polymerase